jgi:hypothetical protein
MPISPELLTNLDGHGYEVVEMITHDGRASGTLSDSNTFVGIDGKVYWVKAISQQGLVAELVAGRLAARLGVGPPTRIVHVPVEAIPSSGQGNHLVGLGVGSEDMAGTVNTKNLGQILGPAVFEPKSIDGRSRTMVTGFRTWIGAAGDPQALVNLQDGTLYSIDHGDCFADVTNQTDPVVTVVAIPSVPDDVGKDEYSVKAAVRRIREMNDSVILEAVARMPFGGPWQSQVDRRLQIAQWLAYRRERIEEVMHKWLKA